MRGANVGNFLLYMENLEESADVYQCYLNLKFFRNRLKTYWKTSFPAIFIFKKNWFFSKLLIFIHRFPMFLYNLGEIESNQKHYIFAPSQFCFNLVWFISCRIYWLVFSDLILETFLTCLSNFGLLWCSS